jgi:hypothetical protein
MEKGVFMNLFTSAYNGLSDIKSNLSLFNSVPTDKQVFDAYVSVQHYLNAFIYSNDDQGCEAFFQLNIPYLVGTSNQLTLADGTLIPLTAGDFLIPIVIKDKKILDLMKQDLFLPFSFLRERLGSKFTGCISLKYADQCFDIDLKEFDPDWEKRFGKIPGKSLIEQMADNLYYAQGGITQCPVTYDQVQKGSAEEIFGKRKEYRSPVEILKQSESLNKIWELHQPHILKTIPLEVKNTFKDGEKPSVTWLDSNESFDLGKIAQEFADKEIGVFTIHTDGWAKPALSENGLRLYCDYRNFKNTVLSISEHSLVLWQEYQKREPILGIGCWDGTVSYISFPRFKEWGFNAQKVLDGLKDASYDLNFLTIPFAEKLQRSEASGSEKDPIDPSKLLALKV